MGQTLLAIVAILVFSIFAIGQHRAQAGTERAAMGSEIELAATALARAQLIAVTALPFDENLIGETGFDVDAGVLTLGGAFGHGNDPDEDGTSPFDDVDDYHAVVDTVSTLRDGQAGRTMTFTVTYGVRYVLANAPGTGSGVPTLAKEVTVLVEEVAAADNGRMAVRCTLSQVVTPAWHALHG